MGGRGNERRPESAKEEAGKQRRQQHDDGAATAAAGVSGGACSARKSLRRPRAGLHLQIPAGAFRHPVETANSWPPEAPLPAKTPTPVTRAKKKLTAAKTPTKTATLAMRCGGAGGVGTRQRGQGTCYCTLLPTESRASVSGRRRRSVAHTTTNLRRPSFFSSFAPSRPSSLYVFFFSLSPAGKPQYVCTCALQRPCRHGSTRVGSPSQLGVVHDEKVAAFRRGWGWAGSCEPGPRPAGG